MSLLHPWVESSSDEDEGGEEEDEETAAERWLEEQRQEARDFQWQLPDGYEVLEVRGNHRAPCGQCGTTSFAWGEYYIVGGGIYDRDKVCWDCRHTWLQEKRRSWASDSDEGEEEEELEVKHAPAPEQVQRPSAIQWPVPTQHFLNPKLTTIHQALSTQPVQAWPWMKAGGVPPTTSTAACIREVAAPRIVHKPRQAQQQQ